MAEHEPGIYFGLDADEYHADPALSATGCKALAVGPSNYWRQSNMNPDKEPEEVTPAKELGTAFHKRLLEGRDAFHADYACRLATDDYPDALDGMDALREYGVELGVKGRSIDQLCARILEKDPAAELWPVIHRQHAEANHGKIMLSANIMRRIEQTASIVGANKDASRALSGGYPEVSLFWIDDESGVRMKARLDYLKLQVVPDLKTFANVRNKPIDKAVVDVIMSNSVQPVVYCDGIEAIKGMLRRDDCKVDGEPDPSFIAALRDSEPHSFVFVCVESCDYPAIRVRQYTRFVYDPYGNQTTEETLYWQIARRRFRAAINTYSACMTAYGPNKPWLDEGPMTVLQDADFPLYATAE